MVRARLPQSGAVEADMDKRGERFVGGKFVESKVIF